MNFTGQLSSNDHRKMLNMDHFSDSVSSMDCSSPVIRMSFNSKDAFQSAENAWAWVNDDPNNGIVFIANHADCPHKNGRVPYLVSSMQSRPNDMTTYLDAAPMDWDSAFDEWELHADSQGIAPAQDSLDRRLIDQNFAINLAQNYSRPIFAQNVGGIDVKLDCENCATS